MFWSKPNPTEQEVDEARRMLVALERLFEEGEERGYGSYLRRVLNSEGDTWLTLLTSGNFWGGMGSIIDCAFCTPTGLGREMDENNRRKFAELIVRLGRHQLKTGIYTSEIKPHIRKWTDSFDR